LIDDVLDDIGDTAEICKNLGDDLREGKMTLPLIYLMQNGTPEQRQLVRNCIANGDDNHFAQILAAITSCGGLGYAREAAGKAAQSATNTILLLPDSSFKATLLNLCVFAVARNH